MKLSIFLVCLAAVPASAPASAWADQASAQACSNSLSPDGRSFYDKVAPKMTPRTDLKEALTEVARPLVMNGSMTKEAARAAATGAAGCLKMLH